MQNEATIIAEANARQNIQAALASGYFDSYSNEEDVRKYLKTDITTVFEPGLDGRLGEVLEDEYDRYSFARNGFVWVRVALNGMDDFAKFAIQKSAPDSEIIRLIETEKDRVGGADCPAVYRDGNDVHVFIESPAPDGGWVRSRAERLCQSAH